VTRRFRASAAVRRLPIKGGLLLLDISTNRLFAFNDTARQVWEFMDCGLSQSKVEAEFASCYGVSKETARSDTNNIITQWKSCGLIATGDASGLLENSTAPKSRIDWPREPRPRWAATFSCLVKNRTFAFAVEPARDAAIRAWFHHFEAPHARPDIVIEVREAGNNESALLVDGTECMRSANQIELLSAIYQTILESVHPGVDWLAMIHGSAIAREGAGLILPAPSGSGKTTLTAYLIARGYTYLADDLILLSAPDGLIAPWPLPLSLKTGSWDVLSETYPDLASYRRIQTERGEVRQFVPPGEVWDSDPVPVRSLVFPRYVPGERAELNPITAFEAMVHLLGDQIWLGYPLTEQRVGRFLAWLDNKPAYRLVHGNVADAALCLERIM
jgi:hypothetical protein